MKAREIRYALGSQAPKDHGPFPESPLQFLNDFFEAMRKQAAKHILHVLPGSRQAPGGAEGRPVQGKPYLHVILPSPGQFHRNPAATYEFR